jgi:hypothetical protein
MRVFVSALLLATCAAGTPRAASPTTGEAIAGINGLDSQVAQDKEEVALASAIDRLAREIDLLTKEVKALKQTLDDRRTTQVPVEAWPWISCVGGLFVLAWTVVNLRRESTRVKEAELKAGKPE